MTLLYIIIGVLAVLAAKSILDVQRLARRYTHARRHKPTDPHTP
jgi:hypothetical protein